MREEEEKIKRSGEWRRALVQANFSKTGYSPSKQEVKSLLRKLESESLRAVGILGSRCIVIETRNIGPEEAGRIIEKWVIDNFCRK